MYNVSHVGFVELNEELKQSCLCAHFIYSILLETRIRFQAYIPRIEC